jgi:hypothetical protein
MNERNFLSYSSMHKWANDFGGVKIKNKSHDQLEQKQCRICAAVQLNASGL